jgi:hypothetical protein
MPTLVSKESLVRLSEQLTLTLEEKRQVKSALASDDTRLVDSLYYTLRRKHPAVLQHKKQSISHTA